MIKLMKERKWRIVNLPVLYLTFIVCLAVFNSCTKDFGKRDLSQTGYPNDAGQIIVNKCATSGCHNDNSKDAAGGISFSSWNKLFEGSNNGAVIIPYRPDFSTFCFFINTIPSNGSSLQPTMPLGKSPLTDQEYSILKNWILNGAPNNAGLIKFSDDAARKKIYVPNYICDVVTVFDSETLLPMRYINVGKTSVQEFVYRVKVAPDNNNWYVSFFSPNQVIQKFDAKNDNLTGQIDLGPGAWSTFDITSDSKFGFFVDNSMPGKIAYVDLNTFSVLATYTFGGNFVSPKGIIINNSKNKIYIGTESGNYIYAIDISNPLLPLVTEKIIDGSASVSNVQSLDPHFFHKTSDDKFCFIGCEFSNEIRMIDMQTDSVKGVFSLPASPSQMDVYEEAGLLFVTCPEDAITFSGNLGSVIVIDYVNKTIIKKINTGFEPYGLGIDRVKKVVAVSNANLNSGGPAPHHTTGCGGRNGYVTFIDLNTLALIQGKKIEVGVFPCWVSVRN
jgi:DNA-binding beta-propeller fold protein YncE